MKKIRSKLISNFFKKVFGINQLRNLLFITKYKKLRLHEYKRWIFILIYVVIYFSIEFYANKNNIKFAIWDTALTTTILVLVIIFGNYFCGWACFMSRFQDVIDILGRFIFRGKYNNFISQRIRNKLKWLKYIIFILTLLIPLALMSYGAFIQLWGLFFSIGMLFCLVESHAYCKYFCFIGALFKFGELRNKNSLVRDAKKCVNCKICSKICLQDCDPATKKIPINRDLWCTSCFRCKAVCPVNAIELKKKNN